MILLFLVLRSLVKRPCFDLWWPETLWTLSSEYEKLTRDLFSRKRKIHSRYQICDKLYFNLICLWQKRDSFGYTVAYFAVLFLHRHTASLAVKKKPLITWIKVFLSGLLDGNVMAYILRLIFTIQVFNFGITLFWSSLKTAENIEVMKTIPSDKILIETGT